MILRLVFQLDLAEFVNPCEENLDMAKMSATVTYVSRPVAVIKETTKRMQRFLHILQ